MVTKTQVTTNSNPRQAPATDAMRTPAGTPDARTTSGKVDRHRRSTSWMHPRVHTILIAVTAWFALAVWSFAGQGIVNYLLFIVSGFIFVAVALTLILSNVGRDGGAATRDENAQSLRDWAKCEYETWAGKLSGAEAAAQILLPVLAAAVGMTAIGLIFYFSAPAGA